MRSNYIGRNWMAEFEKIKDLPSFKEFYCEEEDDWLQYSNWGPKVLAVFGSYKNAVQRFRTLRSDFEAN